METVPTVSLPARQLFEITDAAGVRILCTAGSLWLTLDHDTRDVILGPGDSFEAESPRRALLYAFEPSTFALVGPSGRGAPEPQRAHRVGALRWRGIWAATRPAPPVAA